MIPPFDEFGFLPLGIHPATLEEIEARFGTTSELRRVQMESIRWMIELARQAGAERIILNGSFVTDIIEPNDVDCAILFSPGRGVNPSAFGSLRAGLPFLDIALGGPKRFAHFISHVYVSDRFGAAKGMIEVIRWT